MSNVTSGILRMFKGSQIKVEKRYSKLSINTVENYLKTIDEDVRIVPFEASIALNKLYNNDIKSFIETHIDSHICTSLTSLCREYGPRIKCSIYIDDEYAEIYSECFDVEILSSIVFGDLSDLFIFETGYRDGRKFKRTVIPKKLIPQLAPLIAKWERDRLESQPPMVLPKTFSDTIERLLEKENRVTELIFHIPCLNDKVVELLYKVSKMLTNRGRLYVLTAPPTSDSAERCHSNYKVMIVPYLEILELSSRYNIVVCNIDVMHIGLIVNRAHYIVSYEYNYRDDIDMSVIKDRSYIEIITQNFLKECLCLNSLIRGEYNYSYKTV
ncbi:MAG: hypothetical protein N3D82_04255 [Ignisphaera sp.]|nr:hypothetical protein [Ignisphaera sp.]MCX8168221.1 hypothetical protein [Ignisphaera sp.]MDW8084909.1 hypothetical protein [Ignisphaera sp.]